MSTTQLGRAAPELYETQFQEKVQRIKAQFADVFDGEIDGFRSVSTHFRMRAEFRIWHDDSGAHYAMYEPGQYKVPVIIEQFDIGSRAIADLMQPLLEAINQSSLLSKRLFQIEFLTTLEKETLVTLIYHRPLDEQWRETAIALQNTLGISIIGRSRKQKEILDKDFVIETLDLDVGRLQYKQIETGFSQPNAHVCKAMVNWACDQAKPFTGDLLELYCGNGNFTLPLSFHFDKVLATEVSKLSIRAAIDNIKLNECTNIQLVRLSAEEVAEAFSGSREFRRLKDINLVEYKFSTIFVDPPRAGIDSDTLEFITRFENIIYISCNPDTLKENVKYLESSHQVTALALFDQFPYTDHCECGMILKKRLS